MDTIFFTRPCPTKSTISQLYSKLDSPRKRRRSRRPPGSVVDYRGRRSEYRTRGLEGQLYRGHHQCDVQFGGRS